MTPELDALLYQKYPKIFAQRSLPMARTAMCWGICCGDGWFHLLDVLCEELQRQTDQRGAPQLEATQVKEKYGGLRFYTTLASDAQEAMIDMAESLSERMCEECGAPGKRNDQKGWVTTRCEAHTKSLTRDELAAAVPIRERDQVSVRLEGHELVAILVDGRRLMHADAIALAEMLLGAGVKADQVQMPDWREGDCAPSSGQKIALLARMRAVSGAGMTRDELAAAVPIRERNGRPFFVLIADIPEPWRTQFLEAQRGAGCPSFPEFGPCAFQWDWTEWLVRGRLGDGGPRGLD